MTTAVGLLALVAGVVLVVGAADVFVDGLLGVGRRLGVAPFVLTIALSGFETENLAAGIATNAKGLPEAAAGTFLGGVTFLALGIAGLGGLIAPMRAELPRSFAAWTAVAPLPLLAFALDGDLSRIEGGLLIAWFVIALIGAARSGRELLAGDDDADQVRRPFARLLLGLAVLTGGGLLLGDGLRAVVRHLGIAPALLGNTALAATVEAEELARVAVPARRGRPDLALGNIAGTVIHFAAFNAGVITLVKPLTLDHDTTHFYACRRRKPADPRRDASRPPSAGARRRRRAGSPLRRLRGGRDNRVGLTTHAAPSRRPVATLCSSASKRWHSSWAFPPSRQLAPLVSLAAWPCCSQSTGWGSRSSALSRHESPCSDRALPITCAVGGRRARDARCGVGDHDGGAAVEQEHQPP